MGARPSSFKGGGGFLNDVQAVITGYQFAVAEGIVTKSGPNKGQVNDLLSVHIDFKLDGAEEPTTQFISVGQAQWFGDISDDGLTLYTPEGQQFGKNSDIGKFISSLAESGFDANDFEDTDDEINLEPIIGARVTLVQVTNPKKKSTTGKDGKTYPGKDLLVDNFHGMEKVGGARRKAAAVDFSDVGLAIQDILVRQKDNTISKTKLRMKLITLFTKAKDENRDAKVAWASDDDNLAGIDGVEYDVEEEVLTLAA